MSNTFEQDQRLARLLGWTWDNTVISDYGGNRNARYANGKDRLRDTIPYFHTDGNAVLSLIYHLEQQGLHWNITSPQGYGTYDAAFFSDWMVKLGEGETIQQAVCNAAIKALEAEGEGVDDD